MNPSDTLSGKWVGTRGWAGLLFLVVDDDGLSRELLTLLLEAECHKVEAVASGEEAVTRSASRERAGPDVILTDIQMPGLAGDPLAKALRAALGESRPLLLAMSGSRPAAAALPGFDGFLLKPFKITELQSMISASGRSATLPGTPAQETVDITACDSGLNAQTTTGVPSLDEDIYSKLGELMPSEQLSQMYAMCIGDARKRIVHMRLFAEADDDAQYRVEAHTVKGGSGMIGAKELYELAAAAERDGLQTDAAAPRTSSVTATLAQLSLACDRLERILVERTRE